MKSKYESSTKEQFIPVINSKSKKILEQSMQVRTQKVSDEHVLEIDGNTVHSRLAVKQAKLSPRQRAQTKSTHQIGTMRMFSENLSQEDVQEQNDDVVSPHKEMEKNNTFKPQISEKSKKILERKKQKEEEGKAVSARAANKEKMAEGHDESQSAQQKGGISGKS